MSAPFRKPPPPSGGIPLGSSTAKRRSSMSSLKRSFSALSLSSQASGLYPLRKKYALKGDELTSLEVNSEQSYFPLIEDLDVGSVNTTLLQLLSLSPQPSPIFTPTEHKSSTDSTPLSVKTKPSILKRLNDLLTAKAESHLHRRTSVFYSHPVKRFFQTTRKKLSRTKPNPSIVEQVLADSDSDIDTIEIAQPTPPPTQNNPDIPPEILGSVLYMIEHSPTRYDEPIGD